MKKVIAVLLVLLLLAAAALMLAGPSIVQGGGVPNNVVMIDCLDGNPDSMVSPILGVRWLRPPSDHCDPFPPLG